MEWKEKALKTLQDSLIPVPGMRQNAKNKRKKKKEKELTREASSFIIPQKNCYRFWMRWRQL